MKKITPETLERYYNNTCSTEERQIILEWLNTQEPQSFNEEKLLIKTWDEIFVKTVNKKSQYLNIRKPLYHKIGGIAAALVIILFSCIYAYNTLLTSTINGVEYVNIDFTTISANRGERRTLELSDGSTVVLNSNSEIQFPDKFSKESRIVHLKGHAYFDVKRDENCPFIIYTQHSKTQVLGTSFDVIANSKSKTTEVIVTSGKVRFSELNNHKNKVELTVNKQGILSQKSPIKVNKVESRYLTAWKDNILVFENNSFADIVRILENWYAIDITVKNQELLDRKFTFTYNNPSLEEILERMGFVAQFEYSINGKNILIY